MVSEKRKCCNPSSSQSLSSFQMSSSEADGQQVSSAKRRKHTFSDMSRPCLAYSFSESSSLECSSARSSTSRVSLNQSKPKESRKKKRRVGLVNQKDFFFRFEFPHLNQPPNNKILSEKFANTFEGGSQRLKGKKYSS
jgi:hypothetical protein